MLAGRGYCITKFSSVLTKQFGGPTPFTGRRVRFSPVRVLAGRDYRTNHLGWVLSKDV